MFMFVFSDRSVADNEAAEGASVTGLILNSGEVVTDDNGDEEEEEDDDDGDEVGDDGCEDKFNLLLLVVVLLELLSIEEVDCNGEL